MKTKKNIKVLVTSIMAWDDQSGDNTLQNIFEGFNPDNIYSLYVRSDIPDTKYCNHFFQISEVSLIKRLFNKNVVVGKEFNSENVCIENKIAKKYISEEKKISSYFKKYRNYLLILLRELLWSFGGWKSKDLDNYIDKSNADVIFVLVASWIYINNVTLHAIERSGKRVIPFFVDDNYTYKATSPSFLGYFHRYLLRKKLKKIVNASSEILVISPKMKREYDNIFGINSHIFTKGVDFNKVVIPQYVLHTPIKMMYAGNLLYGRLDVLSAIASAVSKINQNFVRVQLFIYTQTEISNQVKSKLEYPDSSFLMGTVPYSEIRRIQSESDILIYPESFKSTFQRITRLSFSTKITDYLSSGKCILAVGPLDIAPIEYLKDNDCAVVVSNLDEVYSELNKLLKDELLIYKYAEKALECCKINHDKNSLDKTLIQVLLH